MLYMDYLPKNDKKYLLKWAAGVDTHSSKEEDYSLKLIFSEIIHEDMNLRGLANNSKRFDYFVKHENIVIDSLFGLIPYLPFGSVWQNQKLIKKRIPLINQSFNFNCFREITSSYRYNEFIDENCDGRKISSKIMPSKNWSLGGGGLNTCSNIPGLLMIKVNSKLEILIPEYEIIRNFYCDSSRTAILFAEGHLSNNEKYLFDRRKSTLDSLKGANFYPTINIFKSDYLLMSQFAFCEIATTRAINARSHMMYGNSLSESNISHLSPDKRSGIQLPFDGNYNITGNGLWVNETESEVKRFLILNLDEIDYELPYSKLIIHIKKYEYDKESESSSNPRKPERKKRRKSKTIDTFKDQEALLRSLLDPDGKSELKLKENLTAKKLNFKNLERDDDIEVIETQTPPPDPIPQDDINKNVATGREGKGEKGVSKLEIMSQNDVGYSENRVEFADKFFILSSALEKVKAKLSKHIQGPVTLNQISNSKSKDSKFYACKTKVYGRIKKWIYVLPKTRNRRMFHIECLEFGNRMIYFMEVESRTDIKGCFKEPYPCFMMHKSSGTEITEKEIWKLIKSMCNYKCKVLTGSWFESDDKFKTHSIIKTSIKHRFHKSVTLKGMAVRERLPCEESIEKLYHSIKVEIAELLRPQNGMRKVKIVSNK